MMKKIRHLILTMFAILIANIVNAQCGAGASIDVTESRCVATGTITVNGAQGTSLLYDFVSYPSAYSYTGPSSSNVITGLNPGSYTLRVLDGGSNCFNDYTVTVPGNYVEPIYNPYAVNVSNCHNGSNGEIHGTMVDGRGPFLYEIRPGSPCCVGTTNSTGDFTGLSAGVYSVRAYDSCGNYQTRDVPVGNFDWYVYGPTVTKIGCGQYSFDGLNTSPALSGQTYKVKDANGVVIATGSSLPLTFSHPDATIANATVCISDACGYDNCTTFSLNDWSISTALTDYTACNTFTTNTITISGSPISPLTYGFVRAAGDTIWSSTVPFSFSKVGYYQYFWGQEIVKDGCGVVKSQPDAYQDFMEFWGDMAPVNNCVDATLTANPGWRYIGPITYSLDGGAAGSVNSFPNVADGYHQITMTDACGTTKMVDITIGHDWEILGSTTPFCTVGQIRNDISVNRRMQVPVLYEQYDATFSTLISTQTYTNPSDMNNPWAGFSDWNSSYGFTMYFENTLPNTTYNYIATDACGRKDTLTINNGANAHIPNTQNVYVQDLCIGVSFQGKINIAYNSDNNSGNPILLSLWKIQTPSSPIMLDGNTYSSSGTYQWTGLDTGTYVVRSKNQYCTDALYDTVTVKIINLPKLRKSIAFPCVGTTVNAVGSVKGGKAPYKYEIFQTVPSGGEQPLQTSNIFTLNGTYTLVRMRVEDSCQNTSIQDMAVRPPASPSIKITQKLPFCGLNHLNLYVDSIYQGAQYEWKNPLGATFSTAPAVDFPVSLADTGLYTCRVYINGSCFDKTAEFRLRAKEFGCYAQLGNYVWNDVNHDGVQDANEVGVAGVSVALYDNSNTIIGATVTDAYGYYSFTQLNPGTYHVGFTLPSNYVFTGTDAGSDDTKDSDPNTTTGLTGNYTLVAGDSNMTVDAGIYQPLPTTASLGDYVWNDTNHDGIQDPTETGVSGITVTLCNSLGQPVATTITDGNGQYYFNNLTPGTYSVGFSLPIGFVFTSQNQGSDVAKNSDVNPTTGKTNSVTLSAGENNPTIDAGIFAQDPIKGALGNYVWNDVDNNGVQGSNETGVAGVTVTLYGSDATTVLATTTTDEFGYYIFNNLDAGDYVVGFSNIPSGYTLTTQNQGSDSKDSDPDIATGKTAIINLSQGERDMTVDAGIFNSTLPIGALGNYVWYDYNLDGIQDATEGGVGGVTVTLYDANTNAILAITATDVSGKYLFDNLAAGSYVVGFSNLPTGYILTNNNQGSNSSLDSNPDKGTGLTNTIVLGSAQVNLTIDAGIVWGGGKNGTASLGDLVWYDLNNNGIQDADESGVANVTATLYAADGTTVLGTTTTDALGNYIFTGLDAGSYVVGFSNIPAGYTFSSANQGSDDELDADADATSGGKTGVYALAEGEENLTLDAGIYPAPGLASLGNYVWNDLNLDGVQDTDEPGVPGVSVTLFNTSGVALATTSTDANGAYQFTGLTPGTYYVEFTNLPAGYSYTDKDAGTDDAADSDADPLTGATPWVTLVAGQNYPDLDAGIYTEKAGLGNYVWNDINNNGIQDASEPGIPGITVTLYASDGVTPIANAITNADGFYSFVNLDPGTYVVGFSGLPQGATFTSANQGGNDALDSDADVVTGKTSSVTLQAGDYNPTIDAGIHLPNSAGLGNYVWFDADADGTQDASESGVAGVTVTLYDINGTAIRTAITDQNGYYTFTNLTPGTYSVGFSTLPANRAFTFANIGSEGSDNDVENVTLLPNGYPQFGTTAQYTIAAGEYNPNLDAGLKVQYPLGVSSMHADVVLNGTTSTVNWYTIDEKDVKYFDVQRSIDGVTFEVIAQRDAKGNTVGTTNYFINDNISKLFDYSTIYYRIKAFDQDGKFVYSNVVNIRLSKEIEPIKLYPIPFTDKLSIDYPSNVDATITAIITDVTGRKVASKEVKVQNGNNTFTISDLNKLSKGSYFITIKDENQGELFVKKITKQ